MMAKHLVGIVQGRLTHPPDQTLQYFPQDNWQNEFAIASTLGIDYIELFAERMHNERNPIWSKEGLAEIQDLCRIHHVQTYAICNDYIIEYSLLEQSDTIDQTIQLIHNASSIGIKTLVFPLLENSEITMTNLNAFQDTLKKIGSIAQKYSMHVCLETLLDGSTLASFLDDLRLENVVACFDTGNRASLDQDLESDIHLLGNYIQHVHIKDKNLDNQNVLLGRGKVDFYTVMKALHKIKYQGAFTFETFRGRDPISTAKYHQTFLQFFMNETSVEPN